MKTTTSKILNSCKDAEENIRKTAQWVIDNPWIDGASIDMVFPARAILRFEAHCRPVILQNIGASGWHIFSADDFEKTLPGGIRVHIRREAPTMFGEIPEDEMLKGVD